MPGGFNDNAGPGTSCSGSVHSSVKFNAVHTTTYAIRVGSAVAVQHGCGRLNVIGPNPTAGTCPCALSPCPNNPWQSRLFQVMGPSGTSNWDWCLSQPCCFNRSARVTNPCPLCVSGSACVPTSRDCLATAFAASIRNSCGGLFSQKLRANLVASPGIFQVKARSCSGTNPPYPSFVFSVGPSISRRLDCDTLCIVADVAGADPLPIAGPCSFNPPIVELPVSGFDCNLNGDDDTIDILAGFSPDLNTNGVPDECENPCIAFLNETFESHHDEVCGLNGWEEWSGSEDVCGGVTTEQAFSGTQSLKIVGSTGGSTGQGDDTVRRFFGVTSGRWMFRTMTFVPSKATGTGYLSLLSTYDDPSGSPVADDRWALQIHFDSDANQVIADFLAGTTALIKGRWVEFRVEFDLDNDRADYFYDGVRFVQNRSWTCGLGTPFCGTERRLEAVDLYAGEPAQGGTSGMYFDDIVLSRSDCAVPALPGDLNCNGVVNASDVGPFVLALTDAIAYAAAYPSCSLSLADMNNDSRVDGADISQFVALIIGL